MESGVNMRSELQNNPEPPLPADDNAEAVYLANCMYNEDGEYVAIDEGAAVGVGLGSFSSFHNKLMWLSVSTLRREGKAVDEAAVFTFMQNTAVGNLRGLEGSQCKAKKISSIVTFTDIVNVANNLKSGYPVQGYIQSIRDKELLRATISAGKRMIEGAVSGKYNGEEAKSRAEKELIDLTASGGIKDTSKTAYEAYGERVEALLSGEVAADAYKTGFPSIDAKLQAFPRKTNIVIGGRPSSGKTTMGFQIAANLCVQSGLRGVMFSLESPWSQIIDRAVAMRSRIPLNRIRDGMIDAKQRQAILQSKEDVEKLGLLIDDARGRTVFDIRSLARRYKRTHGLDFVLVDHFSKIRPAKGDRAGIEEISAELDDMKHELNCIVITLAQFSRASEREKRRPMMSDLRECGTLEQDADIIMLLSKKEVNGVVEKERRDLFCAKVRDGGADWDITLGFNGPIYRFVDSHRAANAPPRTPISELSITQLSNDLTSSR